MASNHYIVVFRRFFISKCLHNVVNFILRQFPLLYNLQLVLHVPLDVSIDFNIILIIIFMMIHQWLPDQLILKYHLITIRDQILSMQVYMN